VIRLGVNHRCMSRARDAGGQNNHKGQVETGCEDRLHPRCCTSSQAMAECLCVS
jgi:hypothetical protein